MVNLKVVNLKVIIQSDCMGYGHLKGRSCKVGGNETRGGIVIRGVGFRVVIHALICDA